MFVFKKVSVLHALEIKCSWATLSQPEEVFLKNSGDSITVDSNAVSLFCNSSWIVLHTVSTAADILSQETARCRSVFCRDEKRRPLSVIIHHSKHEATSCFICSELLHVEVLKIIPQTLCPANLVASFCLQRLYKPQQQLTSRSVWRLTAGWRKLCEHRK